MNLLEIELDDIMVFPLHTMVVSFNLIGSIVTVALIKVVLADITSYFTGCGPT